MKLEQMVEELIQVEDIAGKVVAHKKNFLESTGSDLKISDPDFLGVILMTPAVSIAMADGNISFFEMRYLGKKSREYSKGRYFPFRDPVVKGAKILAKNLTQWEKPFMDFVKEILTHLNDDKELVDEMNEAAQSAGGVSTAINVGLFAANAYMFGLAGAFFVAWIMGPIRAGRTAISMVEKEKIIKVADQLGLKDSFNYQQLEKYLEG
ncbi:MAG: hypothetical protein GY866_33540 [Proteobacteria bacterium]|nr:hypothetical protein [Pseudomonadota bacterium]